MAKAYLDGDIITFKAGFTCERRKYNLHYKDGVYESTKRRDVDKFVEENKLEEYEIEQWRELDPLKFALGNAKRIIEHIVEALGIRGHDATVFLSGSGNFRKQIYPAYKANRDKTHRPHWEPDIKDYLISRFDAQVVDGQEADDAMGINQWAHYSRGQESVICTIDKDLNMIPGYHYNWEKEKVFQVDDELGMRTFYEQVLKGDTTDNIPGVHGLGEKKASRLLEDAHTEKEMYDIVTKTIEETKSTPIKVTGPLLWIRRQSEEVWEPFKYVW